MTAYPQPAPPGLRYDYTCSGKSSGVHIPGVDTPGWTWTCRNCKQRVTAVETSPHEYRWAHLAPYVIREAGS